MTSKKDILLSKSNGHCWYCGKRITEKTMTVDHVIPQSIVKINSIKNLVPCCKSCNSKKGNRSIETFRKIMGRNNRYFWFSDSQKSYLKHYYKIDLDADMGNDFIFWFEKQGLQNEQLTN